MVEGIGMALNRWDTDKTEHTRAPLPTVYLLETLLDFIWDDGQSNLLQKYTVKICEKEKSTEKGIINQRADLISTVPHVNREACTKQHVFVKQHQNQALEATLYTN